MKLRSLLIIFALLSLSSCGVVISEAVVKESNLSITPSLARENPEEYINENVIWGGMIISFENKSDGTVIEVFATTLNKSLEPTGSYSSTTIIASNSLGRFLIKSSEYLDPLVFKVNRGITVAGVVEKPESRKIGEMDYVYPVIRPREVKLFVDDNDDLDAYYYAPYNPYYRPYYYPWGW